MLQEKPFWLFSGPLPDGVLMATIPSMLLAMRKIFFYALLILYLFITPSIILHALGYMIDPGERSFYKTGLVSIVTEPKGAILYFGGKKFSSKTPAAIHDLLPGRYPVRLVRKGYGSWEKEIEIFSEKATRLEPVVLLPYKPEVETVSDRSYRDFIPGIVDFKIYAWEGEALDTLRRIDLIFRRETPLGDKIPDAARMKILKVLYKEGSGLALFEIEKDKARQYGALELGQGKFFDLRDVSAGFPERVDWDPKDPSRIYTLKDGIVSSREFRSGKSRALGLAEPLAGFGAKHNHLYFLKNNFSLVETNRAGENAKALFEKNEPGPMIFQGMASPFYEIESFHRDIFQKDLFLFLGGQGELLSNWPPYRLAPGGVRGFQYATAGDEEKILYWTSHEIGVIYLQKETESAFEKILSTEVLFSGGENIRQAFWAYEDSHVVFRDGGRMMILEAKNEAPHLIREIGTAAPESGIFYDDRGHAVFYLDPASRNLMKRKITD